MPSTQRNNDDEATNPLTAPTHADFPIELTHSATQKITALLTKKKQEDQPPLGHHPYFRIQVLAGGCSGFRYEFTVDTHPVDHDDHRLILADGFLVVMDVVSAALVKNSLLDYHIDLSGERFTMKNPQAAAGCGCGTSFAI